MRNIWTFIVRLSSWSKSATARSNIHCFGSGDVLVAHMPDEHVSSAEVILATRAYMLAALRYLR
ncbi:MAG TPA: hypothetical protein VKY19_17345 [Ktedonosporobacter sp.]|nr:hypothetical protein [Ktedonosporobacter sp.]